MVNLEGVILNHNAGFFSCCSVRLDGIVAYVNQNNNFPTFVNSSSQFEWFKEKGKSSNDITHDYFEHYDNVKLKGFYTQENIIFSHAHQYLNYRDLHYHKVCPLVEKYFSLASPIFNEFKSLEKKYALDYENTCVLLHRGNDKITETQLCEYSEIIERANKVLSINPQVKFLIQSDETEFLAVMSDTFPDNSFYFDGKIRHMTKQNNTVDRVIGNNHIFSKYYLAITFLMSKCKYLVCGTGNCDLWVVLYRGHANDLYQFRDGVWIEPAPSYVELTPNHPDKDR